LPPAWRLRSGFMGLALLISILAFVAVGADVLIDQWIEGRASALFVFGTACLIAGACSALFAVIVAIGLEPISKSPEQDKEAGEPNEPKKICRVILPANEDAALPLYPGEEALDQPAAGVSAQASAVLRWRFGAVCGAGCDHLGARLAPGCGPGIGRVGGSRAATYLAA